MSVDIFSLIQIVSDVVTTLAASGIDLAVASGKCERCPGGEMTLIAAAWANIAYMTHAALLYYVSFSAFGAWAPLLYVVGAAGALISVALNSPPRNYTWFVLGPAIYGFLIGATQPVQGVDWVVAGDPQNMQEVWRDAETGLKNSPLLQIDKYKGMQVNKFTGPSMDYDVAMPMLFLDELFSTTSNLLVGWTGLYNQLGTGAADTNLAKQAGNSVGGATGGGTGARGEGPWFLMSSLKSPMVENIVSTSMRNPDLKDAFITFLGSECGDAFKLGLDAGAYNAATLSRGSSIPRTVFKQDTQRGSNAFNKGDSIEEVGDMKMFMMPLRTSYMPAPQSLRRLWDEDPDAQGSLAKFTPQLKRSQAEKSPMYKKGAMQVKCHHYLWTLVQAMRHETGHAYWQLLRSGPQGFTKEQMLYTLFYGWDIRKKDGSQYADEFEITWFTQNLIFVYILKNELQFAPSLTSMDNKFSPSEQTRQYTQTYVGSVAAKQKHGELYNWALMMPHVQGILLYVLIVGYPLAAMAMVIPGYWKAFFTWVSFFAWVKMWDVGFAVVQVLERSVWAMMGNHSNMARVANMLIQTGYKTSGLDISCQAGGSQAEKDLPSSCPVPDVVNSFQGGAGTADGGSQAYAEAFYYLDKMLLISASADLDVSNGYYIYIMTALYFAVPAVTGQIILGAKAGAASLATNALGDNARDAGGAAKSGFQGDMATRIQTSQATDANAAYQKAMRSPTSAFLSQLQNQNQALNDSFGAAVAHAKSGALGERASNLDRTAKSFGSKDSQVRAVAGGAGAVAGGIRDAVKGRFGAADATADAAAAGKNAAAAGKKSGWSDKASALYNAAAATGQNYLQQDALRGAAQLGAQQTNLRWDATRGEQLASGKRDYAQRLGDQAEFAARSAQWDAKHSFAQRNGGMASVYGVNAGSLQPGDKPTGAMGMAMSGMLGEKTQAGAHYSGTSFLWGVQGGTLTGKQFSGGNYALGAWSETKSPVGMAGPIGAGAAADGLNAVEGYFQMESAAAELGNKLVGSGNGK